MRFARRASSAQRLQTWEVMHAFRGMGAGEDELREERVRLMTDASYLREWTSPSWMYFPCAWGECGESGALQYVGRRNTACDWCLTNGDREGLSTVIDRYQ